jgi:hypothetical protein
MIESKYLVECFKYFHRNINTSIVERKNGRIALLVSVRRIIAVEKI